MSKATCLVCGWLYRFCWRLRHKEYENIETVLPGDDDTVNIQTAIDRAASEIGAPLAYKEHRVKYDHSRFKWLRREPVLRNTIALTAGEFTIKEPVQMGGNMMLRGEAINGTTIKGDKP